MKAFNIIVGSIGFAFVSSSLLCMIAAAIFPQDLAAMLITPLVLIAAFSARSIVQKIFGYTLYEALSGNKEEKK